MEIRRGILFLLIVVPFGDHVIGHLVFSNLCDKGGTKIYKTISNEQEQRDYWLTGFKKMPKPIIHAINHYGVRGYVYLTKDLQTYKEVFVNECQTNKRELYNCEKANKYIQEHKTPIHIEIPFDKKILDVINKKKGNSALEPTRVVFENRLEPAYLNYCKEDYNQLLTTDKNYKLSCAYTDELITALKLDNVIKVPTSKYKVYTSTFDKNYKDDIEVLFLNTFYKKIYNKNTGEILAESLDVSHHGGWFFNYLSPFPYRASCGKKSLSYYEKQIIPNPYIQNKQK